LSQLRGLLQRSLSSQILTIYIAEMSRGHKGEEITSEKLATKEI
jgi:hypothetical protein